MATEQRAREAFFEMMVAERGAAANTVSAYQRDLDDLAMFLARRGQNTSDASIEDLRAYLAALQRKGASARTAARRLSALRQFYQFLYSEGERADDPTATLEAPRASRSLPKVLSEAETDALLVAARGGQGAQDMRTLALDRTALCHGVAGLRAYQPAAPRTAGRHPLHHRAGQGRARTSGARGGGGRTGSKGLDRRTGRPVTLALSFSMAHRAI